MAMKNFLGSILGAGAVGATVNFAPDTVNITKEVSSTVFNFIKGDIPVVGGAAAQLLAPVSLGVMANDIAKHYEMGSVAKTSMILGGAAIGAGLMTTTLAPLAATVGATHLGIKGVRAAWRKWKGRSGSTSLAPATA